MMSALTQSRYRWRHVAAETQLPFSLSLVASCNPFEADYVRLKPPLAD